MLNDTFDTEGVTNNNSSSSFVRSITSCEVLVTGSNTGGAGVGGGCSDGSESGGDGGDDGAEEVKSPLNTEYENILVFVWKTQKNSKKINM